MAYNERVWTTRWGQNLIGFFRDGKSDWNTNQAILAEDEYFFDRIKPTGTVLDIGAFVGSASLALASLGCDVITVEPLPENVDLINAVLARNGYSSKIYQRAIGANDTDTLKIFYGDVKTEGGNVHEFVGSAFGNFGTNDDRGAEVTTISLDTIFAENNIEHCSLIKIDCEGGEWACFEACSDETLDKIDYIVGELHYLPGTPTTREDFLNLFRGKFEEVGPEFGLTPETGGLSEFILRRKGLS